MSTEESTTIPNPLRLSKLNNRFLCLYQNFCLSTSWLPLTRPMFKIVEIDFHSSFSCIFVQITKAYRKKALKCHPDKNPDDPAAVELFHELSKALEVLTDVKAKAAYDAVLKAKERARLRTQALDAKRKKFKQGITNIFCIRPA